MDEKNATVDFLVSVIVPTYNESGNVELLYKGVRNALEGISWELLFVDDSTDDTTQKIEDLVKLDTRVRCFHRRDETGLATAVVLGFHQAQGKYIAVMDGDLQHPPMLLRGMCAVMEAGYDVCLPSRFIPGGKDGGLNIARKFVSWTARKLGEIMLRSLRGLSDVTGGFFMFRRCCLKGSKMSPTGWKILAEFLATARYASVCEIPYQFGKRNDGISKISLKVTLEYLAQLVSLRQREVLNRSVKVTRLAESEVNEIVERYFAGEEDE